MPIMKAFDLVNWIIAAVALLHKITKVGSGRATVKARGQVASAKYKTHNTNYKIKKHKIQNTSGQLSEPEVGQAATANCENLATNALYRPPSNGGVKMRNF